MIRVKICGITSESDARASWEAGADLLGLNFFKGSPRYVTPAAAARIRAQIPPHVDAVGIFVNARPGSITEACASLRLAAAQLHGDETALAVAEVSNTVPVFKAFRVGPDFLPVTLDGYSAAFAFLLDASQTGQYGGTGEMTDWAVARQAASSHRIILAGGLRVENVAVAIRYVRPYAVDVASGVESQPGKKDHGKLREFIQEVRRAEKQLHASPEISREP